MKYFEFNKHEYWALVAAESLENAYEVYTEEVAGESVEQVKSEGAPKEILKLEAHEMYARAIRKEDKEISLVQITEDFMKLKNTTVLITSELT
ncbi:hypothetical protein [Bacillus sp. C30]|uniref:hypothetical protein n=1 Tax=Bacillus sp. C30 TaxID=1387733 RepID=UPI00349FA5CD